MKRWIRTGMVLAIGFALNAAPSRGQVVERERDVTITGPHGRSIERSIKSERAPGVIDRQVTIHRPGGTYQSNAIIERGPAIMHQRIGGGFVPPPPGRHGGWGPRPFVGREVIINNGGGPASWLAPLAIGGGLFGLGMFAGSALASPPPPPPVVAVPGYVVQPPPPTVIYNAPQPYGAPAPPQQPQTVVIDPVADAIGRLQSRHDNSRRDGAYTLGRLRDPRAIPALVERLKNDDDYQVRVAAATALGEIGDPRAAIYLERVTIYDKKQKVRDAAALALSHLPREVLMPPSSGQPLNSTPASGLAPLPSNVPPAPSGPAFSAPSAIPLESEPTERVPPPPTPSISGPGFPNRP